MNKIPIYEAKINTKYDGIVAISLVDMPAVESNFVAFKEQKPQQLIQFASEEQHNILGCIMRADFPIYRVDANGEYYLTYSPKTIQEMALKTLADGAFKNISVMHNGELIQGVTLQEWFIKDTKKGISPAGFENINDGSLFAVYHIENEYLWEAIKKGIIQGFSLEGYFETELIKNNKQNKKTMLERIKEKLRGLLVEFAQVATEEGIVLVYEGDELVEGVEVADIEGNAVADGEYHFENKTITVANSKVAKVEEKKEEETIEETTDEVTEEVKAEEDEKPAEDVTEDVTVEDVTEEKPSEDVEALKAELENVKAELETVKKELEDIKEMLNKPVAPSVPEQFAAMDDIKPKDWFTAALIKRNK